jgi:hypothetical protein
MSPSHVSLCDFGRTSGIFANETIPVSPGCGLGGGTDLAGHTNKVIMKNIRIIFFMFNSSLLI